MTVRSAALLVGLLVLACAPRVQAQEALESHERILAVALGAAARETGRPVAELEAAPIDPRLRLAACGARPTARLAPGARSPTQITIEVRCAKPMWRQYLGVRVHAEELVVIAARPLSRLQVVAADDVALVGRDLASLQGGYFHRLEDVTGHIAQRSIGPGEVLAPGTVRPPPLVRRGQTVTLLVEAGGLTVRTSGIALADAGQSERIRVRNTATSRQLEGMVISADTVKVALE